MPRSQGLGEVGLQLRVRIGKRLEERRECTNYPFESGRGNRLGNRLLGSLLLTMSVHEY